jgi:Prolyl oligopeptidase family
MMVCSTQLKTDTPPTSFSSYVGRLTLSKQRVLIGTQFNHEWGGRPWEPKTAELLRKMNPAEYVHQWSTPTLVFHGSKDYRLSDTNGISVYHALRQYVTTHQT